jgi:hypothetical protein
VWLTLDQGLKQAGDLARILPDLEAIVRFTRELQQRLATIGVDGISGVLGLHRLLKTTLDSVSVADLERALADIDVLTARLLRLGETLAELKRLKERVGA